MCQKLGIKCMLLLVNDDVLFIVLNAFILPPLNLTLNIHRILVLNKSFLKEETHTVLNLRDSALSPGWTLL